ncbi:MAG: hypothetical protein SAK29_12580 [Scytonema sp. PMC 1069.18]|nr:hypothetical protein [Scytonema sp. PMC 1069.18]MEC4883122.1 hypothetical protein [Scytonema sp. PMC 1070.18]
MLEKLLQAAIITFLLHLIAGLSPNTIKTQAEPPSTPAPVSIARVLFRSAQ